MAKDVQTLEDRLRLLITTVTSAERKWKDMERATGIPATSWVDFYRGKKRATAETIEAVSRVWPQYSFWLSTGITDPQYGHVSPLPHTDKEVPSATRYFIALLEEKRVREKFANRWLQEDLGEDFTLQWFGTEAYIMVRNIEILDPRSESEVLQATRETRHTKHLRRVEIMALDAMPALDYEQTEKFLPVLKALLQGLTDTSLGKENKLTLGRINKIIDDMSIRVKRYNERKKEQSNRNQ
ncbi:hypothetical protein ABO04_05840 [Nitrosomonas sp. HPC101]|uniref:hypothetical protein n=1 Tax=Nitrosomonas sp. HPC101 TaxID=1658667 RepID=UPI00136C804B|nr:hypothetical protein [Nitrosomonas sp. HPC101]MXS85447.1 hypothetical protein [Nitrosomonas sp. HPC101]